MIRRWMRWRSVPLGMAAAALVMTAGGAPAGDIASPARLDARLRLAASRHAADARLAERDLSRAGDGARVSLFLAGDPDLGALETLGVRLRTRAGDVWTADAPLAALSRLAEVRGLTRAALSAPIRTMLDASLVAVAADTVRARVGDAWSGRTGEGVVVGIIDSGVDFTHGDFKRPDGTSRILYLWDQGDALGPHPDQAIFPGLYGTEWTSADLTAGTARARDKDGHGTRVASVAAGDGSASGVPARQYLYAGIAPEADLIVVELMRFAGDTELIDALNYVFERAERLGKPAVVNLSLGTHFGPHDGSGLLDLAVDNLAGAGKLVVAAAGNEGDDSVHAELHVPAGGRDSASVAVSAPPAGSVSLFSIDAYCRRPDSLSVTVVTPSGKRLGPYVLGDEEDPGVLTGQGTVAVVYQDVDPTGDNLEVLIDVSDYNPSGSGIVPGPAPGLWRVVFVDLGGAAGGGEVDLWVAQIYPSGSQAHWRGHGYDPTEEVASPGTARRAITVGSFNSKRCWTNPSGEEQCTTAALEVSQPGQITFFSSRGPTRDGRLKPELCAPGFVVTTATSHQMDPTLAALGLGHTVDPDGEHATFAGTSLAAPHVTGALALLLETMPTIAPEEAVTRIRSSVRTDAFTGEGWSTAGGFGKLDVARLIDPGLVPVIPRALMIAAGDGGLPLLTWEARPEDPVALFRVERRDGGAEWVPRAGVSGPGPHRWQETSAAPDGTRYRLRAHLRTGESTIWAEAAWRDVAPPAGLVLSPPSVNPSRGVTEVAFRVGDAAGAVPMRARVLDARGRVVYAIEGLVVGGVGTLRWDGRDAGGTEVAAGVYWLQVDAGGATRSVKLVRMP